MKRKTEMGKLFDEFLEVWRRRSMSSVEFRRSYQALLGISMILVSLLQTPVLLGLEIEYESAVQRL